MCLVFQPYVGYFTCFVCFEPNQEHFFTFPLGSFGIQSAEEKCFRCVEHITQTTSLFNVIQQRRNRNNTTQHSWQWQPKPVPSRSPKFPFVLKLHESTKYTCFFWRGLASCNATQGWVWGWGPRSKSKPTDQQKATAIPFWLPVCADFPTKNKSSHENNRW